MRQKEESYWAGRGTHCQGSGLGEDNCLIHALGLPGLEAQGPGRRQPHSGGPHSCRLPTPESQEAAPTHGEGLITKLLPQLGPGNLKITLDVHITLPHLWGPSHQEVLSAHIPGHAQQDVEK